MNSRAPFVLSIVAVVAMALGISSCKHDTLQSGAAGLTVAFTPAPAGAGRFERAHFYLNKIRVVPTGSDAAEVYGTQTLLFRLDPFPSTDKLNGTPIDTDGILVLTQPYPISQIALPAGTYKVVELEVRRPNMTDDDLVTPVPTDPAHCMDGVTTVDASPFVGSTPTTFNETAGFTFSISPGQTTLAVKLDIPGFIQAYQNAFTCQVGCGTNDPNQNCATGFNDAAFRTAVQTYLRFE